MQNGAVKIFLCITLLIGSLFAIPGRAAQTHETISAQTSGQNNHCDIVDRERVYWAILKEEVTLITQLRWDAIEGYPKAVLKLVRANGQNIELGEGGKYIDEAREDFSGCKAHLALAKDVTIKSLAGEFPAGGSQSGESQNKTLYVRDLIEGFSDTHFENIVPNDSNVEYCLGLPKDKMTWPDINACSDHMYILSLYKDRPDSLRDLIAQNLPLISYRYSAYGAKILAYDPSQNQLYDLSATGC